MLWIAAITSPQARGKAMTEVARANSSLDAALDEARALYLSRRPETVKRHQAACEVMPGGNTRTVLFHGPVPLCMASGEGQWLSDVDGHRYLNLLGEYTAGIYGHSHPAIRAAVERAMAGGVNLSAHNTYEEQLARLVCDRFASIERVRFTNSGTEANLMAISTARAFTGRDKVMVMNGGYHGGILYFGHGGIPINAPFPYVFGRFNDIAATRAVIRQNAAELACILTEPMMGSGGCLAPQPGFLEMLREEADRDGALLIFDEVMTSRFAGGGAQGLYGVTPDLTSLGKYIGGGMTAGAFGGRADIMAIYDPRADGHMPHAGTFNNNVVTMAAGIAGLSQVFTPEAAQALHARGDALRDRLNDIFRRSDACLQATGVGSIIGLHATRAPLHNPDDTDHQNDALKELFFLDMLEAGIYLARRGFIALTLAIGDDELDRFAATVEDVLRSRGRLYRDG
jgi:glutamate-1-semialdehyde 2,1-aminomutase